MDDLYRKAADIIKKSKNLIALTGAGHSVESGIPDFRGTNGLWSKWDPEEYIDIDVFRVNPEKSWILLFEMMKLTLNAKPNPAHYALAEFEQNGYLKAVITQNIDGLHQAAGSKNVIEFHGNDKKFECLECGNIYDSSEYKIDTTPPKCKNCGFILKPTVIFFGEGIPQDALRKSMNLADSSDAVMVIGTSANVSPAAYIPLRAKRSGAQIIEMNLEKTSLTSEITDVFIRGRIGTTLPELLKYVLGK